MIISNRSGVFDREFKFIKYNLRTGKKTGLFSQLGDENIGLLDPKTGEVLTKSKGDYDDGRFKSKTLIVNSSGKFDVHEALTSDSNNRYNVNILGRDESTGKYFVATDKFSDKMRVYMYNPVSREFDSTPLFHDDNFDVTGIRRSTQEKDFGKILGYQVDAADTEVRYLDPTLKSVQSKFQSKFPGKSVVVSDWSHDRRMMLIRISGSDMPPSFYLSTNGSDFSYLGTERPELAKTMLSKTELVYYPSRDGKQIPGLLTMPVGWQDGDLAPPAIIHPHGGPWARDYAGWDSSGWVPFLTFKGLCGPSTSISRQYRLGT